MDNGVEGYTNRNAMGLFETLDDGTVMNKQFPSNFSINDML